MILMERLENSSETFPISLTGPFRGSVPDWERLTGKKQDITIIKIKIFFYGFVPVSAKFLVYLDILFIKNIGEGERSAPWGGSGRIFADRQNRRMTMVGTPKKIEQLRKVVDPAKKALILTHDNPDPDSIAAGVGWKFLLKKHLGQESTVAFGGIVGRAENQAMIRNLKIAITPLDAINFQDYAQVTLIDTQPGTGNNSLPDSILPDVVIDHHPLRVETRGASFFDVRERVGASSSIITSYLRESGLALPPRLVTALYYGIKSDTQDLGRVSSPLDLDSYLFLFPNVQREPLNRILHPKVSAEYFKNLHRAFNKARIHGSALVTSIGKVINPDMVAEVADMLLRHEGVEWVLVTAIFEKDLILSIRTSDITGGAGVLAQGIVRGIGKAGGHGMSAGGKVGIAGRKTGELAELIRERFLKKVGGLREPTEALV